MYSLYAKAASLTGDVIAAGIEVHKALGPGLLESIYEWALLEELRLKGYAAVCQKGVRIVYKEVSREENLKFDILVEGCLLLEIKSVETAHPIHKAQLLSYMKLLDVPLGLLMNFNTEKLTDGVSRMMLPGANRD